MTQPVDSTVDSTAFHCDHCDTVIQRSRVALGARYCSRKCKDAAAQARTRAAHVNLVNELRVRIDDLHVQLCNAHAMLQESRAAVKHNIEVGRRIRDERDAALLELKNLRDEVSLLRRDTCARVGGPPPGEIRA